MRDVGTTSLTGSWCGAQMSLRFGVLCIEGVCRTYWEHKIDFAGAWEWV